MPLLKTERLRDDCLWGVWEITEPLPELYARWTANEHDTAYLLGISHEGRRRQTLASRVLVQALLQHWGGGYAGIMKTREGRPLLAGHPHHVSVSHTEGYAVALLHKTRPAGIDIEPVQEKLLRVTPRVLSAPEWEHGRHSVERLCIYWCAKEAVFKQRNQGHLSLRDHIHIEPFDSCKNGTLFGTVDNESPAHRFAVFYEKIHTFIVAFVL